MKITKILISLFLSCFIQAQLFAATSIVRFQQVEPGIYRGGRPGPTGIQYLHDLGVKTIINLEDNPKEVELETKKAQTLGIKVISISVDTFAKVDDKKFSTAVALIADQRNHPIYVHCQYGKDRTGLAIGLYRVFYDHWKPQEAYEEMRAIGFSPILRNMIDYFFLKTRNF